MARLQALNSSAVRLLTALCKKHGRSATARRLVDRRSGAPVGQIAGSDSMAPILAIIKDPNAMDIARASPVMSRPGGPGHASDYLVRLKATLMQSVRLYTHLRPFAMRPGPPEGHWDGGPSAEAATSHPRVHG